ncbi:MAG: hypothetical protein V2I51_07350 [Anderseniella sp.]|nr:hypothetical protein [Anderseniella sp.]
MNRAPLRYIDPTGHIEEGEEEQAMDILEMLRLYGVYILIDFGWTPDTWLALGGLYHWEKGAWELNTLTAVLDGVQVMASAYGGRDAFRQALPKGIKLERVAQSEYGNNRAAETAPNGRIIRLFDLA